jgi:hypothetical protein
LNTQWQQVFFVLISNFLVGLSIYLESKKYRKESNLRHKKFMDEMKQMKEEREISCK